MTWDTVVAIFGATGVDAAIGAGQDPGLPGHLGEAPVLGEHLLHGERLAGSGSPAPFVLSH